MTLNCRVAEELHGWGSRYFWSPRTKTPKALRIFDDGGVLNRETSERQVCVLLARDHRQSGSSLQT